MTWVNSIWGFANGMLAGMSQVFVMQPFQIIKVRLQTQPQDAKIYNGIIDCLTKIIKNEGPFALYKGTLTPLMGTGMLGSMRFGIFEWAKKKICEFKNIHPQQLDLPSKSLAALFAGFWTSFALCPIDHTRIRIQIQKSATDKVYNGSFDALVKIRKQHGIAGLFRGQLPSTIRQSTGLMFYFTTIQKITDMLTPPGVTSKKDLPIYVPFIAGGIGGTTYWVFNYPIDYVKTLMQSDNLADKKYKSTLDTFRQEYAANGWKTFYRGYVICMLRSFPVNAAAVVTYRVMQRISGATSN